MKIYKNTLWIFLAFLGLSGCFKDEIFEIPKPVEMTINQNGYFCGMTVSGHPGPKAQIHVANQTAPLWFAQVRDMFGFIMLPGESQKVTAIYVTDMSQVDDWTDTNDGPWIDPTKAWFVINSKLKGGMGVLEVVPFSVKNDAEIFVQTNGGQVLAFHDVPSDYIFDTSHN